MSRHRATQGGHVAGGQLQKRPVDPDEEPSARWGAIRASGCRPQPMLASEASTKAWVDGKVCRGSSTCRWHRRRTQRACSSSCVLNTRLGAWARVPAVTPDAKWRCTKAGLAAAT